MDRPAFPKPCVITIGMTKGGSCKTWWALNLATTLGMNGYRVVVVDLNPQHDLTADSQILLEQGIYPRFDAFSHDITDEDGNINPMPDLSSYFDYDFIIYDTPQLPGDPVRLAELSSDACAFYSGLCRFEKLYSSGAPIPGYAGGEGTDCMHPKSREQDEKQSGFGSPE
jgi:AAA domain